MIRPSVDSSRIYVCLEPVDGRLQINGLAALVEEHLKLNAFDDALYVFTNRRRRMARILLWEHSGFVLWTKRLERERFHWPRAKDGELTVSLSVQALNFLLDGYDLRYWRPHQRLDYQYAA